MTGRMPWIVTFTGLDETTDLDKLIKLYDDYPTIEIGILLSPEREGKHPRYPRMTFVEEATKYLNEKTSIKLAAHLCGGYAKRVVLEGYSGIEHLFGTKLMPNEEGIEDFRDRLLSTVQINTMLKPDIGILKAWKQHYDLSIIWQHRDPAGFPGKSPMSDFSYLYDRSGGRGEMPDEWPAVPDRDTGSSSVGFAGGINPQNFKDFLYKVMPRTEHNYVDYWVDMETGVRDDKDRFDLSKCREIMDQFKEIRYELYPIERERELNRLKEMQEKADADPLRSIADDFIEVENGYSNDENYRIDMENRD